MSYTAINHAEKCLSVDFTMEPLHQGYPLKEMSPLPPLHPIVIHFPIALFVVFVLFDVSLFFGLLFNRERRHTFKRTDSKLSPASEILLVLAVAGAWAAVATGLLLKIAKEKFLPHELLDIHEILGIVFSSLITLLAFWRLRNRWRPTAGYTFMLVICVGFLLLVGHTGGSMVWHTSGEALSSKHLQTSSKSQLKKTANKKKAKSATAKAQKPQTKSNADSKTASKSGSKTGSKKGASTQQPQINQKEYSLGQTIFRQSCSKCHGLNVSKNRVGIYSKSQWKSVVQRMQNYANGSIPNTKAIVYYLSSLKHK